MSVKIGRNDPCWCGSGRKYKTCHQSFDEKIEKYREAGCIVPTHDLIKTPKDIEGIRESAKINVAVLDYVAEHIKAGMSCTQDEMKKAVECGYWHLYRYDPRRIAEGKNPFQLDSPAPDTDKLMDFLMGENRFASLKNNFPERADALYQKEIADVKARYQKYRKMAED